MPVTFSKLMRCYLMEYFYNLNRLPKYEIQKRILRASRFNN